MCGDRKCNFLCPRADWLCCGCHPPCFPSNAQVNLQNGKTLTMSELKIGDHVQIGIDV